MLPVALLCSLSILFIFWVFTSVMVDATLTRKYSIIKTILLQALGFILLIASCAALITIHDAILQFAEESAFDIVGYFVDTLIVVLTTIFFLVTVAKIYAGPLPAKLFTSSFYLIIGLSASDIALILMKIITPLENYYEPPYFIGQSIFLLLFMTAVLVIALPSLSKNIRELLQFVNSDLRAYVFVPFLTYMSYLAICCLWNTQPGDYLLIPQIITRAVVILLTIVMYVIVIYSTKKTSRMLQMDNEMKIARRLQTEILPADASLKKVPHAEISASIRPYREIGGDFYDVFKIDDEKYGIIIADVSGKGTPAALFMMRVKTMLSTTARYAKMPAAVLSEVNRGIIAGNEECMFVTVFFGVLYPYGKFVYSCAGHPSPFLSKPEGMSELAVPTAPVLGIAEYSYVNSEVELDEGDMIFLYTDGLTESVRKTEIGVEETYCTERLISVIRNQTTAEGMISAALADYAAFSGGAELSDDVTMLAFRYRQE